MYGAHTVTVVIPAYNEEATIAAVIRDFRSQQPLLDEILIVDNNSGDRTAEIARLEGARVIREEKQGYGNALRSGMDHAAGDILILCEADGSFRASDLNKFLAYIHDAGMVVGTRTTKQMIDQGARMTFLIRMANIAVAKFLELLWFFTNETRFTDIGCTYRGLWRDVYGRIRSGLHANGPDFSPEMMAEALRCRIKVVEIPVKYFQREGGESKHSLSYYHLARTALKMIRVIIRKRLEPNRCDQLPQRGCDGQGHVHG
ncbi:MAG: glycosyltransferase family 2 protein [bacterium]